MSTIITALSRYKEPRNLERVSDNSFLLHGKSDYMRFSTDTETLKFTMIDFEGGPFLEIGGTLEYFGLSNLTIVSIEDITVEGKENCFLLTTEEIEPS